MADVISPLSMHDQQQPQQQQQQQQQQYIMSTRHENPLSTKPYLPPMTIEMPTLSNKNGLVGLDVLSPVNQNGSFEFDRVLKSGHVYKRSRKTKQWKKFFLVLRSNLLSMYRNESEEKLLKQVQLSDLTAVNILKDPKGRREHMFGLFTPSHNYHFQAGSGNEAQAWVDLIRKEARIDEEEESIIYGGSPPVADNGFQNFPRPSTRDRLLSSSPEPADALEEIPPNSRRPREMSFNEYDYSGQEANNSYSDFSDAAPRTTNLPSRPSQPSNLDTIPSPTLQTSQQSTVPPSDSQRILFQSHTLLLRRTPGTGKIKQYKKFWTVLRPSGMAFYKDPSEYTTHLLIPLPSILSAIEIDPLSKSKVFCMQVITEERSLKLVLESEEALARCLGAVKSLLARRKGIGMGGSREEVGAVVGGNAVTGTEMGTG